MKHKLLLFFFLAGLNTNLIAQTKLAASDSELPLSLFYRLLLELHPVVKQAQLMPQAANANLLQARGAFDPVLQFAYDEKTFDKKNYYTVKEGYLKLPTTLGLDFKAGFESVTGDRVNPETATPLSGLAVAGVSVPIGRNLLIDDRRATLRQARLFREQAKAEQDKMVLKFLFQATKDYAEWLFRQNRVNFLREGYRMADERYRAVRERVLQGDLAGIDTTEAVIALKTRAISLAQAETDLLNAQLFIAAYLWDENGRPLELNPSVRPVADRSALSVFAPDSIRQQLERARFSHPEVRKLLSKIEQIKVERSLARNNLLPAIQLNLNAIQTWPANQELLNTTFIQQNYKIGASFYMPLFLRKERGKLRMVNFKLLDQQWELDLTRRQVEVGIKEAANDYQLVINNLELQRQLVLDYLRIRDGEQIRFDNGESNFFMVNTREVQMIESQVKLAEMEAKQLKASAGLWFAAGQFEALKN